MYIKVKLINCYECTQWNATLHEDKLLLHITTWWIMQIWYWTKEARLRICTVRFYLYEVQSEQNYIYGVRSQNILLRNKKKKNQTQTGIKYLQMTNPTRDLYPEQIRNSLNSAVRKQTLQLKMGKRLEHFIKQDILMVNKGQKYI